MKVYLFKPSDFTKRTNSTKRPSITSSIRSFSFKFKENVDIYTPTITLFVGPQSDVKNFLLNEYNYAVIDFSDSTTFSDSNALYYFVDNGKIFGNPEGTIDIPLKIDTLASYVYGNSDIINKYFYFLYGPKGNDLIDIDSTKDIQTYYDQRIAPALFGSVDKSVTVSLYASANDSALHRNVISYVTSEPTPGYPTGVLLLNDGTLSTVASKMMDSTFFSDLNKQLTQAKDAIISVKRSPVVLKFDTAASKQVVLCNYETGSAGYIPDRTYKVRKYCYFEVDTVNDKEQFSKYSPYSKYYAYLNGYGYIEIDSSYLCSRNGFKIDATLDQFTGDVCVELYAVKLSGNESSGYSSYNSVLVGRYLYNIFQDIPMGVNKSSKVGSLTSAVTSVASVVAGIATTVGTAGAGAGLGAGMIAGGASGLLSTATGGQNNVGSQGGLGGLADLGYDGKIDIQFVRIFYRPSIFLDANGVNMNNFRKQFGYPYFKEACISVDGNGYYQSVNIDFECNLPYNIREQIKAYMNGGFYYE